MDKRIEGTFANQEMLIDEITHLIKQEGYAPEQLLVITRNGKSNYITEETAVQVIITSEDREEDSLWDKIVKFFTVDLDEEEEEAIFERYGIDEDTYERFEDALDDGELLLLIDDAAPINDEHAEFLVRDGILPAEKAAPDAAAAAVTATKPDWTSADSEEAGDVPAHSIEAEKKLESSEVAVASPTQPADAVDTITGQPVEAETVTDPAMADDGHRLPEMQFDKEDSLPEVEEEKELFSKDPFGGDTVAAEAGEDADDIDPDYEEMDKPKPAL